MDARKHLEEAEDCLNRSWERWGERNHTEIGAIAAEAHITLARIIKQGGRKYAPSRELIEKAEDLLEPGGFEMSLGVGECLNGARTAKSYALLAEEKYSQRR